MKQLIGLLLVTSCAVCNAQFDPDTYTPLRSQGTIPQDLISFYIKESENSKKSSSTDFIEHNTVEFGNLFASGKILFNDPLSTYAKKVLDTLLYQRPDVRSKVRIYTLKSSVTNAYTTNDGKIFITTGLFARLENEAQLAFILSHELIHYLNRHAYESYVFNRRVDRKRKKVMQQNQRFEDVLLTKFRHSRENEFDADKEGLGIFLSSTYALSVVDSVFRMLDYSDLPVENIAFDRSFLESSWFHVRDEAWLKPEEVQEVSIETDFKESKSTHPNSKSRITQLQATLDVSDTKKNTHLYLFPEKVFSDMRNIARFELSNVLYLDENYEDAIYNSWLLLKKYPGNLYLRKNISRCLYGLLGENAYRMGLYDHNKKRGYISQLAHVIRYSDREELEKLAVIFTWNTYKEHDQDNDLKILLNNFFSYLDEKDRTFYYNSAQAESKLNELKKFSPMSDSTNKYSKIYTEKQLEYTRRSCFADLLANKEFSIALQQVQLSKEPFSVPTEKLESKNMFVIPQVYIIDSVSGSKEFSDPQKVISDYSKKIKDLGTEKNLDFTFLSTYDLKPGDVDRYNDYSVLSDWISVNGEKDKQSYIDWEGMKKLGDRYNSRYLCLSGIYIYKNTLGGKLKRWLLFTFLVPPGVGIIPGSVQLFTSNYSAYYSTIIYDVETGKVVSRSFDWNIYNFKPQTKKKNLWHTLRPWYEDVIEKK